MKRIKLIFLLTISLALVLVVVQNTAPVNARFLWLTTEVPVIVLLLFLTAAGGFVSGLLAALLAKSGAKT